MKYIVLTGASGKFGRVLTTKLLENGYGVIGITSREESRNELESSFKKDAKFISCDLTSEKGRSDLINTLNNLDVSIYGLISNARSLSFLKTDEDGSIPSENFLGEFNLGVVAAYDLATKLSELDSFKRVINISSMYGVVATNPNLYDDPTHRPPLHYGVVKAALNHMTKELATRLIDSDVVVNSVSYGGVQGRVDENFLKNYSKLCPSKKMLKDDDIYSSIQYLLDEASSSMVGHNLVVDGGWTLW